MVIKCVASMLTMHWQSLDVEVKEESPTLASVVDNNNGTRLEQQQKKNEEDLGSQKRKDTNSKKSSKNEQERNSNKNGRMVANSALRLCSTGGNYERLGFINYLH